MLALDTISLGTLHDIVDRARTRFPHLASRLDRAVHLLLTREIKELAPRTYYVESQSGPMKSGYVVNTREQRCLCQDWRRASVWFRQRPICKHLLACMLLEQADREQPPAF